MNNLATIESLRTDLGAHVKRLTALLPDSMTAEKFAATVLTAVSKSKDKNKLLSANRQSLLDAVQESAKDGLLVDGKQAALVVFKNMVTYMPMVQGLVTLSLRHPDVEKVEAYVVYESDYFSYKPATDSEPDFQPDWKIPPSQKGEPCLAYAVVTKTSGQKIVRIVHRERILAIAADTRNSDKYSPKSKHFEEWWKKTAIRAVLKFAPKSVEADNVIEHDNQFYKEVKDVNDNTVDDIDDINNDIKSYSKSEVVDAEFSEAEPQQVEQTNTEQKQDGDVF